MFYNVCVQCKYACMDVCIYFICNLLETLIYKIHNIHNIITLWLNSQGCLSLFSIREIVRVLQTPNTPTLRPIDLGVPEPQNLLMEVKLVQSTCVT